MSDLDHPVLLKQGVDVHKGHLLQLLIVAKLLLARSVGQNPPLTRS
jgi:hypothetical protein